MTGVVNNCRHLKVVVQGHSVHSEHVPAVVCRNPDVVEDVAHKVYHSQSICSFGVISFGTELCTKPKTVLNDFETVPIFRTQT